MTNPGPRPALRKAPDAHVHPALSLGTPLTIDLREDRGESDAALSKAPDHVTLADAGPNHAATTVPRRAARGTSEPRRVKKGKKTRAESKKTDKQRCETKPEKKDRARGKKTKTKKTRGKKPGAKKKAETDLVEAMTRVPRGVRQQLRSGPKARGTSIDEVVTSVLEGWSPR